MKAWNRLEVRPGDRYGRLTIGREVDKHGKRRRFLCRCDCGNDVIVSLDHLRSGHTRSCGCLQKESVSRLRKKHGMYGTPEHYAWRNMVRRCNDSKGKDYKYYGGRGVKVCDRWLDFNNFYEDMGPRPGPGYSIDRIDNNGNYEPGNCRWVTLQEQANNRRNNHFLTYSGETKTFAQWSREIGVSYGALKSRINNYGWSVERALTEPVRPKREAT